MLSSQQTPPDGQTPPAGGQTPPAGGQTPPAGGQTPPAGGQTPPAGGQTPPAGGQTPPAGPDLSGVSSGKTTTGPKAPPDWLGSLSEDLRSNEELAKFDSIESLAKAYASREKPAEIPALPTDYKVPDGTPEYIKDFAHKAKLTQEQLLQVVAFEKAQDKFFKDQQVQDQNSRIEELKKEWGDRFKFNSTIAKNTIKRFDPEGEIQKVLEDTGFINEPKLAKFLYNIGSVLQEHGFLLSEGVPTKSARKKSLAATLYPNHPQA